MSLGLQATKRRMASVGSTRKITNAMHLVSTAKFKTWKNKMEKTNDFADELMSLFSQLSCSMSQEDFDSYFQKNKKTGKKLFLVITSSLGLCAGYNYNVFKLIKDEISDGDQIYVIGTKGAQYFVSRGFTPNTDYLDLFTGFEYDRVKKLSQSMLSKIRTNEVDEIKIVYTEFVNSITFVPHVETIFPLSKENINFREYSAKELNVLIEPSPKEVLDYLVPLYFESVLYGRLVESEVSEHACRRNAMESATDNADEIISRLQLDYNKARQAAITQEITEIVGGANAQK